MEVHSSEEKIPTINIDWKITTANDIHHLAPHEVAGINKIRGMEVDLMLGDIIDLDLCKKKHVERGRNIQNWLEMEYGERFISGNHALMFWNPFVVLVLPNGVRVLATHGDYIFYSDEHANNYRKKKAGSGFIRRAGAKALDFYRMNMRDPEIKPNIALKAARLAKEHNCETVICGHSHRKELGHANYLDVNFYVLPRGINRLTFNSFGQVKI